MFDNNAITNYEMQYINYLYVAIGLRTKAWQDIINDLTTKNNQLINDPNVSSSSVRAVYSTGLVSASYCQQQDQGGAYATINWKDVLNTDLSGAALGAAIDEASHAAGALIGGTVASALDVGIQLYTC